MKRRLGFLAINYEAMECPTPEKDVMSQWYAVGGAAILLLAVAILHQLLPYLEFNRRGQRGAPSLIWACLLMAINLMILAGFQYDTDATLATLLVLILLYFVCRLLNAALVETHWFEEPLKKITGMHQLVAHPDMVTARDKYRNFSVDMVTITFLGTCRG